MSIKTLKIVYYLGHVYNTDHFDKHSFTFFLSTSRWVDLAHHSVVCEREFINSNNKKECLKHE